MSLSNKMNKIIKPSNGKNGNTKESIVGKN
jgi:hypothetical protein